MHSKHGTHYIRTTRTNERQVPITHGEPLLGVGVPRPLHVIEDQPCQRDDHEDHKGYGQEQHGGLVDSLPKEPGLGRPDADPDVDPGHVAVEMEQVLSSGLAHENHYGIVWYERESHSWVIILGREQ